MARRTSTKWLVAVLATALSLHAQTARSASTGVTLRAEVAKVLKLQTAQMSVQQGEVAAEVHPTGPATLRVEARVTGASQVLRLPVAITANVRSFLLQARVLSEDAQAAIGLVDAPDVDASNQDRLGRRFLSRMLPLERNPVFALATAPVVIAGASETTIELRFAPVPAGEMRRVRFELLLLESGR